jgi:hypothetical protein
MLPPRPETSLKRPTRLQASSQLAGKRRSGSWQAKTGDLHLPDERGDSPTADPERPKYARRDSTEELSLPRCDGLWVVAVPRPEGWCVRRPEGSRGAPARKLTRAMARRLTQCAGPKADAMRCATDPQTRRSLGLCRAPTADTEVSTDDIATRKDGSPVRANRTPGFSCRRDYRSDHTGGAPFDNTRSRSPEGCRARDALMSFFPLQRTEQRGATCDGFASPTSLRPQVFSTSRRFAPPAAFRACFIPVTLMGFEPLRGFPPLDAEHLSAGRAPHDVCRRSGAPPGD